MTSNSGLIAEPLGNARYLILTCGLEKGDRSGCYCGWCHQWDCWESSDAGVMKAWAATVKLLRRGDRAVNETLGRSVQKALLLAQIALD